MDKILVAVDFSHHDAAAMRYAVSLARQHQSRVFVVHVVEPLSAYFGQAYWGTALEDETQRDEQLHAIRSDDPEVPVEHVMLHAETTGLTTDTDIASELLRYAADHQMDLIVVSSHGRSGVMPQLFGGVTEYVVRRAKCPVLVVKEPYPQD